MDVIPPARAAFDVLAAGVDTVLARNPRLAVDWCRAALGLLSAVPDGRRKQADLLLSLARAHARIGELTQCRTAFAQWSALVGPDEELKQAADILAILSLADGRFTHARVILRGAVGHPAAVNTGSLRLELAATAFWDTRWSWSDAALAVIKEDQRLQRAHALVLLAVEALDREEVDQALRLVKDSADLVDLRTNEDLAERPVIMSDLGWAEIYLGQNQRARQRFMRGLLVCEASGQYLPVAPLQAGLAELALRQGALAVAADRAERAVSAARSLGHNDHWAMALVVRSDVALGAGRHDQALADATCAMEVVDLDSPQWRRAHLAYATVVLANGDSAGCVRAVLDVAGDELGELPVWERRRAAKLLGRAERAAGRVQHAVRWEGIRARYEALLDLPDKGAAGPVQVSRREFEIARLVSEGRTNRQIARVLEVSHKTVETHLARIFAKSGVSSRAELAGLTVANRVVARPRA
ncbi:LuxR C-terminal-related transcriptional regulator [Streptomyces anulatus]|uniref:helix-turn-helix transcriptional regulator n=1 Tax=Streptomyces TaxID=1883 RepID=UPI000BF23AD1|nr:LuxR C-terminal-related transcriptional regulator [Streptomyces sp. or20]WSV78725.1 LuxR C-terminal-related transcriptional regulator [Streptomyces anulatus]